MKNTKLTIKGCCCDVKMSVTMKCWCPLNMDVVLTHRGVSASKGSIFREISQRICPKFLDLLKWTKNKAKIGS